MILFLTSAGEDLAPDLLFNGLVELLGHDKIIDFPYAEYRHKKTITGYGRNFFCVTIDKDVENRNVYSFEDIKQLINRDVFDLCIVSNRSYITFVQLIENTTKFPTTVVVNGEDDSDKSLSNITTSKYWNNIEMVLQRDYKYNRNYSEKIVPYNFSCPVNILPKFDFKKDKEIDIFAQFPITHPFRKTVVERLKKIKGINANIGHGGLQILDYFKAMNNAKISISITGAGWDTPHYLEIPFMKSMLLAQCPMNAMNRDMTENPVAFVNNFIDRYSATFYDTKLNNIEELIRYYLDNDKEREQITKRGYEHLTTHLTTKNAAEYMFKCIENKECWKNSLY
jgi:uncharacterized lipoprotein YehR (DUF1307 family)